jgi:hypothetical protein
MGWEMTDREIDVLAEKLSARIVAEHRCVFADKDRTVLAWMATGVRMCGGAVLAFLAVSVAGAVVWLLLEGVRNWIAVKEVTPTMQSSDSVGMVAGWGDAEE